MYKIMQKYSKKVMAILSIFLMITFVVQQSTTRGTDRADGAVATVGGQEIKASEWRAAKDEWEYLNHYAFVVHTYPAPYPGMPPQRQLAPAGLLLGDEAYQEIQLHPEMYLV